MTFLKQKSKWLAAERKLMAMHAIVKMGVDRNVHDVWFQGLTFAAVANEDLIVEEQNSVTAITKERE